MDSPKQPPATPATPPAKPSVPAKLPTNYQEYCDYYCDGEDCLADFLSEKRKAGRRKIVITPKTQMTGCDKHALEASSRQGDALP